MVSEVDMRKRRMFSEISTREMVWFQRLICERDGVVSEISMGKDELDSHVNMRKR